MQEFDIHGRALVQSMYTELEKIAYSAATRRAVDAANRLAEQHKKVTHAAGWNQYNPFSRAWKATAASKKRAQKSERFARGLIDEERAGRLKDIKMGWNVDEATDLLNNRPRKTQDKVIHLDPKKEPKKDSGFIRKALLGTGAVGLTAGAVVGGKRMYDRRQRSQQSGAPGGY